MQFDLGRVGGCFTPEEKSHRYPFYRRLDWSQSRPGRSKVKILDPAEIRVPIALSSNP
jgi:hypothetical protein